jgi:DNA-binding transcriptional regulator YbjK
VTDGRRRRGELSRQALLAATLTVIERDGVAGVTHRKVTREAGLPSTAAAYHFSSITELLEAALSYTDQTSAAALASIAADPDPVRALAQWLVDDFSRQRLRCMAEYELYLHAARTPALRTAAIQWISDLTSLVGTWTDEPSAQRRASAYVDGLLVQALVAGEMPPASEVEADLRVLTGARP